MNSTQRTARIAGLLYLIIIVCAGFAQGYVRGTLVVPGDAATTAANIAASEMLFRAGLVADLIAFLGDLAVSVLLYVLLRPVHRTVAMVAMAFRLLAHPAIGALNLLNHWAALAILGGGGALQGAFRPEQLEALALLAMEAHGYGYLIAGAFFGLHLLLLGWLMTRTRLFPKALGLLVLFASVGYIAESFGMFLFPAYEGIYEALVVASAVLGEIALCLYLLIKGVRTPDDAPRAAALAAAGGAR